MPLPYAYNAMEPFIDTKTMELHHDKHLQAYVDNLNHALENYPMLHKLTLEQLLVQENLIPEEIRTAVHNNGGGVYNHRFYFNNLKIEGSKNPVGLLGEYIKKTFGSDQNFKNQMKEAAMSVFGSGYAWLVVGGDGVLRIITTANQDTPLPEGLCPVLNLDVWEHAYYLKHYNVRADYIDDWFQVVNWEKADENYRSCFGM